MKIRLLALFLFAALPAGAADPAPFAPMRLELPPSSTPQPSGIGLVLPLPAGPVRMDYGTALRASAKSSRNFSNLDAPGPGYRDQRARFEVNTSATGLQRPK